MPQIEPADRPIRLLLTALLWIFGLFLLANVAFAVAILLLDDTHRQRLTEAHSLLMGVTAGAWTFARPILQLAAVLVVIDWTIRRWGFVRPDIQIGQGLNVQAIIALIIVGSLALAVLIGVTEGIGVMKDLALVVVGFYFGTQKKSFELQDEKGKLLVSEEHTNERASSPSPPPKTDA